MKSRKLKSNSAEQAIAIQPIALCMIQYFDLNNIYTYSLVNKSTASIMRHFTESRKIKKNIDLSKKINQSLQSDAKKMLSYSLVASTTEETKDIQTMLKKIADGETDKKLLSDIKNKKWEYKSTTQDICTGITSVTSNAATNYLNDLHERKNARVKDEDLYLILFLYGVSGISYLANLAVGLFNSYFYKPPQATFKHRLDFIEKKLDKDPDEDKDSNNQRMNSPMT